MGRFTFDYTQGKVFLHHEKRCQRKVIRSSEREEFGKGLGLFMTKMQVETLGGKISLTSELNKGTEFKIEFDI